MALFGVSKKDLRIILERHGREIRLKTIEEIKRALEEEVLKNIKQYKESILGESSLVVLKEIDDRLDLNTLEKLANLESRLNEIDLNPEEQKQLIRELLKERLNNTYKDSGKLSATMMLLKESLHPLLYHTNLPRKYKSYGVIKEGIVSIDQRIENFPGKMKVEDLKSEKEKELIVRLDTQMLMIGSYIGAEVVVSQTKKLITLTPYKQHVTNDPAKNYLEGKALSRATFYAKP